MTASPVVFLHGVGSTPQVWEAQVAAVAPRRGLAIPFPGYLPGTGPAPTDGPALADRLWQAVDQAGADNVHVVGLSLGAVAALHMHEATPKRILSLVLADGFLQHPQGATILASASETLEQSGMAGLAASRAPRVLAPGAPAEMVGRVRDTMANLPPDAYRAASRIVWLADVRTQARRVRAPTTVLVGEEDVVTPLALSQATAAAIPGARLVRIPGAGHLSNLDRPEAFNAALRTHLEGLP